MQDNTLEQYAAAERMNAAIVDEVKSYLSQQGLTQTQLAERLGVSKGQVSRLLNAPGNTKLSTIVGLAAAIGKEPMLVFTDGVREAYRLPERSPGELNEDEQSYGSGRLANIDWNTLNSLPLLAQASAMKADIDNRRPFSRNMEEHVLQQTLRIWNYNSNAIEGNKLTYGETLTLLLYGITADGKPLRDHLDIIGHQDAVELMLDMVKGDRSLRQTDVRQLHQIMLKQDYPQYAVTPDGRRVFRTIHVGTYKREPNHVVTFTGDKHYYAEPSAVPGLMRELLDWYVTAEKGSVHPLVQASVLHHEFVAIHPFDDGNGRIGRILMNFVLMRGGYPPAVIPVTKRREYYESLMAADAGDYIPLTQYIGQRLLSALDIQLATARGEDIGGSKWDTPDDDPR